jgi:hypothetical protein
MACSGDAWDCPDSGDSALVSGKGNASFRGGTLLEGENATPSGRLEIVAADGSNPEVNVGDVFSGATIGPLDYSQFGGYFITATTLSEVQRNNPAPTVATGPAKKQLSIATYNVENPAPTDPASKFQALADGVVRNLADPDIIAVEEVQDNDGATDNGAVSSTTCRRRRSSTTPTPQTSTTPGTAPRPLTGSWCRRRGHLQRQQRPIGLPGPNAPWQPRGPGSRAGAVRGSDGGRDG